MTNLSDAFQTEILGKNLLKKRQKVFVACSGGADSVALFSLLLKCREQWNWELGIFHINHGLRGAASDADEKFVKSLARQAGVPCYTRKRQVKIAAKRQKASLEEAARQLRYDSLVTLAKQYKVRTIVTAHTQDDQAETVLMRVIQGTGLRGLSGIRQMLKRQNVQFVRPLLAFSKQELLDYLREHKIKYRLDRSNLSLRFVRNRIRRKLIPNLAKEYNPRVSQAVSRLSDIVREENELLASLEDSAWKRVLKRGGKQSRCLDRAAFSKFPAVLQYKLLERALKQLDGRSGLNYEAWRRLRPAFKRPQYRCTLPRRIELVLTPTGIEVTKKISSK